MFDTFHKKQRELREKKTCIHCKHTFSYKDVKFGTYKTGGACPNCHFPLITPIYIKEGKLGTCECGSSEKGIFVNKRCINPMCKNYHKR